AGVPLQPGCAATWLHAALLAVHQLSQLRELLAAQLVALAAVDAVEQLAHERRELDRVEGLRDVVDAADVEAARTVPGLGARREEDDRDRARALVLEQLLGDAPAVEPRHHHVEEHDVRSPLARLVQAARAVGGLEDVHPLGLEIDAAKEADRRLIVDYEHTRHVAPFVSPILTREPAPPPQ